MLAIIDNLLIKLDQLLPLKGRVLLLKVRRILYKMQQEENLKQLAALYFDIINYTNL